MEDIVVVIPVHEYNESIKNMLSDAMGSCNNKICIACPKEVKAQVEKDFVMPLMYSTDANDNSFSALVNGAVKFLQKHKYKWFSVLEFDDTYKPYWFGEVERYYKANPEVSAFLPLTQLMREKDGQVSFCGYGNEAPWASAFSNEIGFIDFEVLTNYFDFYLTGSVFSVDDFIYVGGLKESMKVVFWYEFLLRLTHMGKKVYVVPKLGYVHLVDRKDSLFDIYKSTLSKEEIAWWYDLAKEECYFIKDRNKIYDNQKEEEEE